MKKNKQTNKQNKTKQNKDIMKTDGGRLDSSLFR